MGVPDSLRCLIDRALLHERIGELAAQLDRVYAGREVVLVGVLKGAHHFLSELLRRMRLDPRVEFVRVVTYGKETTPAEASRVIEVGPPDLAGKDVLVVEDILDRGGTVKALSASLGKHCPRSLRWVFLLVKEGAIERSGFQPDFVGFTIPDEWVVGYGLDRGEQFRNLEGIYAVTGVDSAAPPLSQAVIRPAPVVPRGA